MGKDIISTKSGFKQVCEQDRYIIQALLKEKFTITKIAQHLGKDRTTIDREIKRGTRLRLDTNLINKPYYDPYLSHLLSQERSKNKGRKPKLAPDSKEIKKINKKMKTKYSPDATVAFFKNEGKPLSVCTKTIYNYIHNEYFPDIHMKIKKRKKYTQRKVAYNNTLANSIDNRPIEANERKPGHAEMDCVVGKGKTCLLVITFRCSRREIIRKMPSKTQKDVAHTLDMLEKQYGEKFSEIFKTITCDNGSEFLNSSLLEKSILNPDKKRTIIYYAHPYSAWERGSNEVANKPIRKFIPKGADISKFNDKKIQHIEDFMNNYPRRMFDYKNSNTIAKEQNDM